MYKKFALVNCAEEISNISFQNTIMKYLPIKMIHSHILKKTPLTIEKIVFFNTEGYHIILPIISSIIKEKDEEYIKIVIQNFNSRMLRYNVNVLILSEELKAYKSYFNLMIANEKELQLLYIHEFARKIVEKIPIDNKNIKYAIIDGNNMKAEYVMDSIYNEINTLTLITDKPEKYVEKIEKIYDETGLAIEVTSNHTNQEIDAHIIINCNIERDKLFYCFKENSYLIDFYSQDYKIKDMKIKREDIHIITNADIYIEEQMVNKELVHGLLLNKHRILRSTFQYGYRSGMYHRIRKILNDNPIHIGKLYS